MLLLPFIRDSGPVCRKKLFSSQETHQPLIALQLLPVFLVAPLRSLVASLLPAQDATLVIDQLAHFHAQWWNHPRLDTFSWLPLWGGDSLVAQNRYVQFIDPFLQRFGSRVPKRVRETMDALTARYGAVRERLQQTPATMIHGDLHLDNILFSPFEHKPGVTLIDWQSVARGRGAIDLALFLFGSLETTTRRAVEDDLLRQYHEMLVVGGVTGYDFPQLIEDCLLVLLWLLGAKVV